MCPSDVLGLQISEFLDVVLAGDSGPSSPNTLRRHQAEEAQNKMCWHPNCHFGLVLFLFGSLEMAFPKEWMFTLQLRTICCERGLLPFSDQTLTRPSLF